MDKVMKLFYLIRILLVSLFFVSLISCMKEGDVGPRGEAGQQGVEGADGATIYSGTSVPASSLGKIGDFYFNSTTGDFYGPKTESAWGVAVNLKGATGIAGPQGAAGSKIWSGTTVPISGQGAVGDFYFRTSTADFYGAKTSSGWGSPINLKGIQGADGSRILSGVTVPALSLGREGDFYFRTATSDFYGPKTAAGWGVAVNLKGATGGVGSPGSAGSKIWSGTDEPISGQGAVGDFYFRTSTADFYGAKTVSGWGSPINLKGIQGADGSRILSGATVPAPSLGRSGDFYFRTTTSDFFGPKTTAGWGNAVNLKGATGAAGTAGTKILSGTSLPALTQGVVGDFYFLPTTGDFYGPKSATSWGSPINLKGTLGADGTRIYSGAIAPTVTVGKAGDFYFNSSTNDFYGPKTASSWGTPVNLKGATGVAGSKIWNGAALPPNGLGTIGDYYLDTSTGDFYGAKTAAGWGDPIINLKGSQTDVIYSGWMKLEGFGDFGDSGAFGSLPFTEYTYDEQIINNANISIYVKELTPVPNATNLVYDFYDVYQLNYVSRYWKNSMTYSIDVSTKRFLISTNKNTQVGIQNYLYRYVIIPGNRESGWNLSVVPKNYNQIKVMYKIPD